MCRWTVWLSTEKFVFGVCVISIRHRLPLDIAHVLTVTVVVMMVVVTMRRILLMTST